MSEPISYTFDGQLAFSDGAANAARVDDICMKQIPGAVSVERASKQADRNGTDWWIRRNGARPLSIDAKVRKQDWAATHPDEDDLALETWSVVESGVKGWTRNPKKQTDYILWLWVDTGRWCLISFPMLCAVMEDKWREWIARYKTKQQFTPGDPGYHSECVFVPRREIWKEIYNRFAGTP